MPLRSPRRLLRGEHPPRRTRRAGCASSRSIPTSRSSAPSAAGPCSGTSMRAAWAQPGRAAEPTRCRRSFTLAERDASRAPLRLPARRAGLRGHRARGHADERAGSAPGHTRMSPAEIDAFLESQRTLVLVTLRPDGSPVAHPLWFTKLGDAALREHASRQPQAAQPRPRRSGLRGRGGGRELLRAARRPDRGPLHAVEDPEEIARVRGGPGREGRAASEAGSTRCPRGLRRAAQAGSSAGDRLLLRIPMERVFSWDFSKLRQHYTST